MKVVKVFKPMMLSTCLACALLPTHAMASAAKGWEEQAWRAGFLASHSRFLMVADMEDETGHKVRVMSMRGFTDTIVDGVFIAPVGADGLVGDGGFRGYAQSAAGSRVIDDNDMRDFPGAEFSSQHWWIRQAPATSFAQWWAMVLAVPQQPRAGGCRFSSWEHEPSKQKVWLPRACNTKDPVTGRLIKLQWDKWRAVSQESDQWQLWVPGTARVEVEGKRYNIELRNLQMRSAHGGEPRWPLSLVPQAFPQASSSATQIDEVEVPVEDLDYHQWKVN